MDWIKNIIEKNSIKNLLNDEIKEQIELYMDINMFDEEKKNKYKY